ncbi:TPA: hypothetical protein N0F65_009427 [Lagenidium giganteum]|uniref:Alpha-1,3/1,6-mannosyltransferase ALG2 n=1 Tax=Lagenidium giganteum TaxID=4803 RepID=A0AAV2ZDL8_9STRA|nr:TPA: hypothetical protein N0F65_009427 [Lagenidium giganteum]
MLVTVAAVAVGSALLLGACLTVLFLIGLSTTIKPSGKASSKKPLRVGFVHPDFGIGGAENLVVNAALALQKNDVLVTVFTAHHDVNHCFEETRGDGPLAKCVRVHGDWLPKTIAGKFYAFCAILRIMYVTLVIAVRYAGEIDVFFVDQVSMSIPFLRCLGKPVLFYGHYPDKLLCVKRGSALKRLYRLPLDTLEEVTTAASDLIVVNSKYTRSVYEEAFPRVGAQELGILYPPVDVSVFEKFKTDKPRDHGLFVSLNRFERKKNIQLAIHALAHVRTLVSADTFASIKLIVAGGYDPNNQENIEHLKELQQEAQKLGIQDKVEFRTSVSDFMKKELLTTAQAILYTPSNEHFGIVPVEAMTCGTPVIAVNSGGPLESVLDGETGFLCESSAEAFGAAIAKLSGNDREQLVERMGAQGKKRARDLFSLETFADTLYSHVKQLA